MNLLHALVAAVIENFSTISRVLSACFRLGVVLSYLTAFACVASAAYFRFRRRPERLA